MVLIDQTRPQLLLLHGACPKTARLNEKGGFSRARVSTKSCNSPIRRYERPTRSRQRVFSSRITPRRTPRARAARRQSASSSESCGRSHWRRVRRGRRARAPTPTPRPTTTFATRSSKTPTTPETTTTSRAAARRNTIEIHMDALEEEPQRPLPRRRTLPARLADACAALAVRARVRRKDEPDFGMMHTESVYPKCRFDVKVTMS